MSVKYRIELGNCQNDINSDVVTIPSEPGLWTADSIIIKADSITATADGTTY